MGRDFFFNFPGAGYLLLFIFLILFLLISLSLYRKSLLKRYTSSAQISALLFSRSRTSTWIKGAAWVIAWMCLCFALMDPKGNLTYTDSGQNFPEQTKKAHVVPHTIIFLVDTSNSMDVFDGRNKLSRLENAKAIMQDVITKLDGQNIALYGFTSSLIPIVPPTLDYYFTRIMIGNLQINEGDESGETNLAAALSGLKEKMFMRPSSELYTLIVLSDGGDNTIEKLEGAARKKAIESLSSIIPDAKALHLYTYTIGLGSLEGGIVPRVLFEGRPVHSKLNEDVLEEIAKSEQGIYFRANEYTIRDLAYVISQKIEENELEGMKRGVGEERSVKTARSEDIVYDLYYKIPLGIALLLLMLIYLIPEVRRRI